jgi:hypothetical protein
MSTAIADVELMRTDTCSQVLRTAIFFDEALLPSAGPMTSAF